MAIEDARLDVLPNPLPVIGAKRPRTDGSAYQHVYAATGRSTVEVPLAGPSDVDAAVAEARAATPVWKAVPVDERRRLLLDLAQAVGDHADELAAMSTTENGTPVAGANMGRQMMQDCLRYYAGWPDKITGDVHPVWPVAGIDYSILEPYGVVAIIIPWNSPLFSLGLVIAPALAAGNCVVVKPPELTPFTSLRVAELALEVGFPPGVINVVPGDGAVGSALVSHRGIDKIHFTGSGPTARRILHSAAENLTPVATELGGKSPNLVFADADLDLAAQRAVMFCMQVSGQGCVNGTRVLVQDSVHDELVERVREAVRIFTPGDPAKPDTTFGPVVNQTACDRIMGFIDRAKQAGAGRIVAGGGRAGGDFAEGFYIEPTVFADVDRSAEIVREEIFGPVLSIVRFSDEQDAIAQANDTDYGLASYIQTKDLSRAHRMADALDAGMVWINGTGGLPPSVPFGGVKQSGVGRLGGYAAIQEFSRTKNVWIGL
ncbi:aldehyde dehydrogenase [Amycolatopsis acidicola]|uniref:Aldehyde dehydrogenase n=1 Tax=Amycolatopsis acidicola TaxID=2596893 RepID=A0A5N0VEI7_9PSEU|nr:aldehyde dehydrogenase family protein [Amycolatopsis acidicola]KAA9164048.1 aldehyde dehydrogenase [Amycolatopsis acidicola]